MAWTADRIAAEEIVEPLEALDRNAAALARLIRTSKHFIVFTGAGVSTSAGIPDFRGPDGAWTLQAQGRQRTTKAISTLQAIPTVTHMALVALQVQGLLKHVVSQNCDGLHRRSGISAQNISELHGNNNLERCVSCDKEYLRDFRTSSANRKSLRDHYTERKCAACGGKLQDTIINFGESLPEKHVNNAFTHARKADLCLVLGSSLRVSPANEVPEIVGRSRSAKLAICNLQETPLDHVAKLRSHSKTDDLMVRVMQSLEIPIPPFILRRRLVIDTCARGSGIYRVAIGEVDVDNTPATFLRSVKLVDSRRVARSAPFELLVKGDISSQLAIGLELEFMGNYAEPNLRINYCHTVDQDTQIVYDLHYDLQSCRWDVQTQSEA